jgi:hypothetical protein
VSASTRSSTRAELETDTLVETFGADMSLFRHVRRRHAAGRRDGRRVAAERVDARGQIASQSTRPSESRNATTRPVPRSKPGGLFEAAVLRAEPGTTRSSPDVDNTIFIGGVARSRRGGSCDARQRRNSSRPPSATCNDQHRQPRDVDVADSARAKTSSASSGRTRR